MKPFFIIPLIFGLILGLEYTYILGKKGIRKILRSDPQLESDPGTHLTNILLIIIGWTAANFSVLILIYPYEKFVNDLVGPYAYRICICMSIVFVGCYFLGKKHRNAPE